MDTYSTSVAQLHLLLARYLKLTDELFAGEQSQYKDRIAYLPISQQRSTEQLGGPAKVLPVHPSTVLHPAAGEQGPLEKSIRHVFAWVLCGV